MAFETGTLAITASESSVFSPSGETALMMRNTGSQTVYVGPTGATTFPIEEGELILFGGITFGDDLYAKCDAGQSSTLELIWTEA